jgi:fumarate reductase subunit D
MFRTSSLTRNTILKISNQDQSDSRMSMSPIAVSCMVFALVFAGALAGMGLRRILPEEHFGADAKDTVRLAIGLVVTMTGLVLGMLVSSAKTYHDAQKSKVAEISAEILFLDQLLTIYGPEAKQTRIEAHQLAEDGAERIWPSQASGQVQLRPRDNVADFYQQLQLLAPKNDMQIAIKAELMSRTLDLRKADWLMFLESEQTSASIPLVAVVTSWLLAIFISFGIFAPPNSTVIVTLIVCAVAVSAAIFIIMEMYSPFSGIFRISPTAIHDALNQMATH